MTVASMTGFARVTGEHAGWQWAWEVKSVNARSLDMRFRMPGGYDRIEMTAREVVAKKFKRGSFNFNLSAQRTDPASADRPMQINKELLDDLVQEASQHGGRVAPDLPRIETLLTVRGVVEPVDTPENEDAFVARIQAMLNSLDAALDALDKARRDEGNRLKSVLEGQLGELERLREEAMTVEATRPEKVFERLCNQIREVLRSRWDGAAGLSEERLTQEVALLVAKGDIREEIDRLDSHIAAARDLVAEGEAIGRRLDFLCQEMTREANTVCSKAGDVELTRIGLAMKAVIEQFREQVQNVE